MKTIIATWETKGADRIDLFREDGRYAYEFRTGSRFTGAGGVRAENDAEAIAAMMRPWGHPAGAGAAFVLQCDRPSLKQTFGLAS